MADDYTSTGDFSAGKRKYDDSAPPRRQTGFSAPILHSQSPDSATGYNDAPVDAINLELAKQKAQEIAARIYNSAEAKRPKFDNGGGGYDANDAKGFTSAPADYGQKPYFSTPAYGYGGGDTSKKIEIPNGKVGVIIGKGGETIKYLQQQSGAKIQVTRDADADPHSLTRGVELNGTSEAIAKAEQLIKDVLAEADAGGSGTGSRRLPGQQGGAEQFVMQVPTNKVGLIIGKGGETIKSMQASSGARIQVIPLHPPPGDTSTERTVQIDGSSDQIEAAKQLVNEVISENRLRNPMGGGGYSQQGYQTPQTNWAPPGQQIQQQGYGYMQPGAYPGQPTQYTQPPYGGYPRPQTSGGYAAGWDQSAGGAAPPGQQTPQGGGGYDYYNQQQAPQTGGPSGPTDGSNYGYGQQGQTYGQDGYGGYGALQSGYGQPQGGYDQQGYANPTSGYNVSSETTEGQTGSYGGQGDSANQAPPPTSAPQSGYAQPAQPGYAAVPPASQPGYGTQPPSGYGSYGPPPTQKPPVTSTYGQQPQQSPQGGYTQPAPYAGGYAQADASGQRPPPAYGAGGYAQAPYGQQPQAYGSSYGSGYPQQPPPAYSGDGAAPAPQTSQSSGGSGAGAAAKASPQS